MKKLNIPDELLDKLKTQSDVGDLVGDIYKQLVEKMLEKEMDEHLGYSKNDRRSKKTSNHRNGKSTKTLKSEEGEVPVEIPRDRAGEFDPVVVPKHERMSEKVKDAIISFYAKKARGLMSRYIIENSINEPSQLKGFDYKGYYFDPADSTDNKFVFKRDGK